MTNQRLIFSFATSNLRLHWLRSLLSVLGIIIGVLSIISMGMIQNVTVLTNIEQLQKMDSFILNINPDYAEKKGLDPYITERQVDQIRNLVNNAYIAPFFVDYEDSIKNRQEKIGATIYGVKPRDMGQIFTFQSGGPPKSGTEIVIGSDLAKRKNLIIGSQITLLFKNGDEANTRVVGILNPGPGLWLMNPDYAVFPYESWLREKTGFSGYHNVLVKVQNPKEIGEIKAIILQEMNRRDKIIDIFDQNEFRDQWLNDMQSQAASTTAIAGISLVVAGVSIFNVMVMSVMERYKEIGVLRSIGTRRSAIVQMFLYECILLGLVGTMIGTILGVISGYIGISIMGGMKYFFDPSTFVSIPYAMSFGLAISLCSGLYPAWKASRLNPIEALRHD